MTRQAKSILGAAILAAAATATPAHAVQLLTNGNFENGITGWTSYAHARGTITEIPSSQPSPPVPQVATTASFNTTGAGASNALFLNAGAYLPDYVNPYGGGVFQTFTVAEAGSATFFADIAAYTRANSIGVGLLSVFLDGVLMDSHDFGDLNNSIARSTLGFTTNLTAGQHTITLEAARKFAPARGVTSQYFDNVSFDLAAAPAVPEPATWAMMLLGFGVVGSAMRRRKAAQPRVTFAF